MRITASISHARKLLLAALVGVLAATLGAGPSAANVNVSKSGWAWDNPVPQGRTLTSIAFAGGIGYAVGFGGTALATNDAGQSWTGLTTGTSANLERVQVLSASAIVVGGGGGCVTRISEDGGSVFRRIFNVAETGCAEPVAAFSFLTPKVGFLLLRDGSLEATTDGGETFSRRTGVPGTGSSSTGGSLIGADLHFFNEQAGIVFIRDPQSGATSAYRTPDGGVSWVQVPLPADANVTQVHYVDEKNAYAIGPNTLLRTTDGGETWEAMPIETGNTFNSIDCSSDTTCLLTVTAGNELIETSDGGTTDTVETNSSSLIYAAAYDSPTSVVAVGESGATVLSGDGGATFRAASSDIGGQYSRLRVGPGGMLVAPGSHGNVAISSDGGASWHVIATQTSTELVDAAFGTPQLGYALDSSGGLQRTTNGGVSWQTLSPGTSRPAAAVAAIGSKAVLLFGPVGVSRAVDGGPFRPVSGAVVSKARLSDYDLAGGSLFAFGAGSHTLIRSSDEGAKWSAIPLPLAHKAERSGGRQIKASPGVSIRSVAFSSANGGLLLDTNGRLWKTSNAGRTWQEVLSAGASPGLQLASGSARSGFLSLRSFGSDSGDGYVLHTSDGGVTWQPQEIASGHTLPGGLVASGASDASLLLYSSSIGGEPLARLLFSTTTGGEPAGSASTLKLGSAKLHLTEKQLKAAHGTVRVTGSLSGAVGGETIVVSRRDVAGGRWSEKQVVAGANGGSFATTWHISRSSVFVAQWLGDSGRPGAGSKILKVTVSK